MLVITQWGDTGYPYGLITGLPAVGTAPWYGIFPAQQCVQITLEDVVAETHQHNLDVIARPKPGVHDEFLIAQSLVDVDKGFGTPPMRWSDLVRSTGADHFVSSQDVSSCNLAAEAYHGRCCNRRAV